jgi:hypothetical protein
MKRTKIGICKLCLEEKDLTFEHVPPRSANNKSTTFVEISSDEYYTHAHEYAFFDKRPKARIQQGGVGGYFLCESCNNFLGTKYVKDFTSLSKQCSDALLTAPPEAKGFEIELTGLNLYRVLKQITAIFICCNGEFFATEYPELIEFVRNEDQEYLPDRHRFYLYLNNEGQLRSGNWTFMAELGVVCDFAFPPLGFVLSIDSQKQIDILYEITAFRKLKNVPITEKPTLYLNKLPTYYPFPLDFRTLDELNSDKGEALPRT